MQRLPPEAIWSRVGREPSGLLFNSIVQLEVERGVPRNPFINAGALVVTDILASEIFMPQQELRDYVRQLSAEPDIDFGALVARSEMEHKVLPCETRTVT